MDLTNKNLTKGCESHQACGVYGGGERYTAIKINELGQPLFAEFFRGCCIQLARHCNTMLALKAL